MNMQIIADNLLKNGDIHNDLRKKAGFYFHMLLTLWLSQPTVVKQLDSLEVYEMNQVRTNLSQ
jgi:hypothetical protein